MSRLILAVGVTALLAASAQAQTKSKVHRLEINNGFTQSVRYFGTGLTPTETATLRNLEQVENETYYARNLTTLKKQYVATENILEPQRRQLQYQNIGADITFVGLPPLYNYGLGYGYGYYGRGWGVPGYTYSNWAPALAAPVFGSVAMSPISNNVGMESPLRDAVAKTVAQQATPEYVASLERAMDRALMRASASPTLRTELQLPSLAEARKERTNIIGVAAEENGGTAPVCLILKSGEKVMGKSVTERDGWMVVELPTGGRTRIRASEVIRVEERGGGGSGVKPIGD